MPETIISLGTNWGNRWSHLNKAKAEINELGQITKETKILTNAPFGYLNQPNFLNQLIALDTKLKPEALLNKLQIIEAKLGRKREIKWGPRIIDLDIITFDNVKIQTTRLTLPHPGLQTRKYLKQLYQEITSKKAPALF